MKENGFKKKNNNTLSQNSSIDLGLGLGWDRGGGRPSLFDNRSIICPI